MAGRNGKRSQGLPLVRLAWQEGDGEGVLRVAGEAEDLWRMARGPLIMWKWTYLWPLVSAVPTRGTNWAGSRSR